MTTHTANATDLPIARLWDIVEPGDTILVLDGHYVGDDYMVNPPRGLNGIILQAEPHVYIDGEGQRMTMSISGSEWVVDGFHVFNSSSTAISIGGRFASVHGGEDIPATGNIVRNTIAWQEQENSDNEVLMDAPFSSHHTWSNCAGFGTARKLLQVYRSLGTQVNNVWLSYNGRTFVGPDGEIVDNGNKYPAAINYRSFDTWNENLYVTCGDPYWPRGGAGSCILAAMDWMKEDDSDLELWGLVGKRQPTNTGFRANGITCYADEDTPFNPSGFQTCTPATNIGLANIAVSIPPRDSNRVMTLQASENSFADQLTAAGGPVDWKAKVDAAAGWEVSNGREWNVRPPGPIDWNYRADNEPSGAQTRWTLPDELCDRITACTDMSVWPRVEPRVQWAKHFVG